MTTPLVTLRCPSCGQLLTAPALPGSPTSFVACPHCANPVAVVPMRDPAPLFSWEVFPHLYPILPVVRAPSRRAGLVLGALLLIATVAIAASAGALLVSGLLSLAPGHYTIAGTVDAALPNGSVVAVEGATVVLVSESPPNQVATTDANGAFRFTGVPPGGVELNVSAFGFDPAVVSIFVSSVYTAAGGSPRSISVTLTEGNGSATTTVSDSPFTDLESFVASVWASTVLLALAAVVSGAGAVFAIRGKRPAVTVAGSAGALASPAAVLVFGLDNVFDWTVPAIASIAALAIVALTMSALPMAATGPAPDPD